MLFEQKILNDVFDDIKKTLRVSGIDSEAYYQFDTTGTPQYVGINTDADALDTADDWIVYQINSTKIRKKVGAWSNRASLF